MLWQYEIFVELSKRQAMQDYRKYLCMKGFIKQAAKNPDLTCKIKENLIIFFFCKRYFLNSLIDAEPHVQCQGKSYHNVVFLLPKILFKQPKEETSSSPMPDLTSKRVGVGELLAIAPSRRTSKFGDFSIAKIYEITLDDCL